MLKVDTPRLMSRPKPKPEDYGFQPANYPHPAKWESDRCKEKYELELEKWIMENRCPECHGYVGPAELKMFSQLCEECFYEHNKDEE